MTSDADLRRRAAAVVPGGMYGHLDARRLWPGAPQFVSRAEAAYFWDADGHRYVDLMCSWGPVILGHRHPDVEAAAAEQHARVDCGNGPSAVFVELAELLVDVVDHADWAMLAKNGSDATTLCLTLARAHTGRRTILVAQGAYHGALPWCTPLPTGVVPGDRAHLVYFRYNDLEDMQRVLAEHRGDVAGVIVCPFRHDAGFDQELVDPEFAHGLRAACDEHDALLILDDVRAGFRMAYGSSWEPLGVRPDLSAWSKAIGNGHPIAAVLGSEAVRSAAQSVFATGSFWMSATAMAAAIATIKALKREDGLATMQERGQQLCEGLRALAAERGLAVNVTGPATMPYMTFADDPQRRRGELFASVCAEHGAFLHPRHNWFLSAQHTRSDIEAVLAASVRAFDAVLEA